VGGLGASLQGGRAPLLLVPGSTSGANLSAAGHEAGELYVTSDSQLMFFTGATWLEVAFVPPAAAPQSRPSGASQQPGAAALPLARVGAIVPGGPVAPLPMSRP
jgi:hypothetical protein